MKRIIMDLDDTICQTQNGDYVNSKPVPTVIEKMHEYKALGFEIAINTSRNMRTYQGNTGKITANTLPIILKWLEQHNVPYDEIYVGKPWCGMEGFYVDDRSIRPNEFVNLSLEEINQLLGPLDMEEHR
ncbi:HAD-IIIC family phosphatase [Acinetobacter sp. HY1485]|uniref:HAD-IIIC family phosphatase n=1 Tax=Acinetobacter sp. HY1485 TaxID=2970918 RepID=UPI0022B9C20F|nr:HAD-IIIC family phosphatase [Acinetobacter sp. HY1485]